MHDVDVSIGAAGGAMSTPDGRVMLRDDVEKRPADLAEADDDDGFEVTHARP